MSSGNEARSSNVIPDPSKLALVTGAGQGIGEATTRRLVRDGWRVIALDKRRDRVERLRDELSKDRFISCEFDLAHRGEIPTLIKRMIDEHGLISVLVNNAGIWVSGPIAELSDETWDLVLAINLTAAFALIRALAPVMAKAGGGAMVNVASRNAFRSSTNNGAYDASKAGLVALTRTAAGELAQHHIRVNAVCPGVISTPGDTSIEEPLFKTAYTKQIPMARYGKPEEIAGVISFLISQDASFITGQTVMVDGGQIACQDNQRFLEIPGLNVR